MDFRASRDSQLEQDMSNQKQTGVLPGKDPCHGRHYAPQLFCEFYLQPVYRAASLGFSTLIFSAHSLSIERPSFFLAYAGQHLPMLRLRPRFKPKLCACGARPTAGLLSPADLILPSSLSSFTLSGEDFTTCALRVFSCSPAWRFC
jgi:hypothetical protein